jgi:PAS domain S-box-containing protein
MDDEHKTKNELLAELRQLRKQSHSLKASEERLRTLFDTSPVGIMLVKNGLYQEINPAFLRMFGYGSARQIIGRPVEALYTVEGHDSTWKDEGSGAYAQGSSCVHCRGRKMSGEEFPVSLWLKTITLQGEVTTLGFVVDTSEQDSFRQQLVQAQKMEAIGTLAGGVAHDFNNILTIIHGYAELLLMNQDRPSQDVADLETIMDAARRGADLVSRLMTFSRQVEPRLRPMHVNDEITRMQQLLERTLPKTIVIELHLARDLATVHADPGQIEQALINLAINGRDAMPDGGTLTIGTCNCTVDEDFARQHLGFPVSECVELTVADSGHGMRPEVAARIFEPFFSTKGPDKGTGLGLSMVYGIVKQHGGHITCESHEGRGSTFRIYLPVPPEDQTPESTDTQGLAARTGHTILLVDDEPFARDLGKQILGNAGYQVLTASDGREAFGVFGARTNEIDLVILDWIMPNMGGQHCLEGLLMMAPGLPVLVTSGTPPEGWEEAARASGAKELVRKPFSQEDLLGAVQRMLEPDSAT